MQLSQWDKARRGQTQLMKKATGRRHGRGGAHSNTMPLSGIFYNLGQSGLREGGLRKQEAWCKKTCHLHD